MLRLLVNAQLLFQSVRIVPVPPGIWAEAARFLRRQIVVPMLQNAAGRVAGRHLGVSVLLFLGIPISLGLATRFGVIEGYKSFVSGFQSGAILQPKVLLLSIALWLIIYTLLVGIECLLPSVKQGRALLSYVDNPLSGGVLNIWLHNCFAPLPIPDTAERREAIQHAILDSTPQSETGKIAVDHIRDAISSANLGETEPLDLSSFENSVGIGNVNRFFFHLTLLLVSFIVLNIFFGWLATIPER